MISLHAPFSWHHLDQWHLGLGGIALLLGATFIYLWGIMKVPSFSHWRTASFFSAIVITFLATQSVLGVYDMTYFSVHMIQHLLLIMVAAPLFALSGPLDLLYEAGSPRIRKMLDGRVVTSLCHPLVAFGAYFVFIPLSHLTGVFNLMLNHEWFHHLEQVGFLVVGYLFFRIAFGIERGKQIHPGLRLVFVMAAVPVDTVTGLALMMNTHVPYPGLLTMAPMGASTQWVLGNFHLGGAIMWIGGDALMLLACIPITVHWVRWETKRTRVIDAELDAMGL
ncbi:MAG: cytochrome c oxidase assembly protein [Actinomycetota bacterium]